jgi:hypothetical protein
MHSGNTFVVVRVVDVSVDEPEEVVVVYISLMRYNPKRACSMSPTLKGPGWFIDSTCTRTGGEMNSGNLQMRLWWML